MSFQDNPFLKYYRQSGIDNPFQGPLAAAVQYDHTNVSLSLPREIDGSSQILPGYEWTASFLVEVLKAKLSKDDPLLLDLGSGTGAATLMMRRFIPGASIEGVDQSEGMLQLARYKCSPSDNTNTALSEQELRKLFPEGVPEILRDYWQKTRMDSLSSESKVGFTLGDMRKIDALVSKEYDGAVANHSLHWLGDDLGSFFSTLANVLKPGAPVVWNTASDFVDSQRFPSAKYSWRYSQFMGMVAETLQNRGYMVKDYTTLRRPRWEENEVIDVMEQHGFSASVAGTVLVPKDFKFIVGFYLPLTLGSLVEQEQIASSDLERLSREIAAEIIAKRSDFGADLMHQYDINPIFVGIRR